LGHHVCAVVFQKVKHVGITMQSSEVKWGESVCIWVIYPCFQLALEGAPMFIPPMVGFIMLDKDAQLG
jgi:hypothetical protein